MPRKLFQEMSMTLPRICVRVRIAAISAAAVLAMPAAMAQSGGTSAQRPMADNTSIVRCQPLSGDYRAACEIRIAGLRGTSDTSGTSGSVTDNVSREVRIVVRPVEADRMGAQPKAESPMVPAPSPATQ
jgi:hypothetical protein